MEYDLNIRAMLSAYYCGTGGFIVGMFATFFGIPGGRSWDRAYFRNMPEVHGIMLDLCNLILGEALSEEIKATMQHELENVYTKEVIDVAINNFLNGNYSSLPTDVLSIGISVSFDMGWQKRSTGRLYDSISGHGFIIGC